MSEIVEFRVKLIICPDERWPDVGLARDTGQERLLDDKVIEVDEETAQRWERGIAAYDALVAEIWAVVDADEGDDAGVLDKPKIHAHTQPWQVKCL